MQDGRQQSLSRRQAEIANLIVAGKSSREIAETLFLSPRTIEHHLKAIFNKLGVGSRVGLLARLIRTGDSVRNHLLESTRLRRRETRSGR
jgi:DNA-binding CsgD family transcriptional regulator